MAWSVRRGYLFWGGIAHAAGNPAAARKHAGQCGSTGANAIFPIHSLPRGGGEVHLLYCLSAGQHSLIQAVALCRGILPLPGSPPGSVSAPEEMPSSQYAPCPEYAESPPAAPPFCRTVQPHISRGLMPGKPCRCPEARRAVCQPRNKCHLPGTLLALRVRNSPSASALPNKNAAFARGKPGRGRRAVFIRLRRNFPLHCWSGTQLRPDSPAR